MQVTTLSNEGSNMKFTQYRVIVLTIILYWVNACRDFGYMTTRLRNVLIPKIKNATIVTLNPNMIHGMARVERAWP